MENFRWKNNIFKHGDSKVKHPSLGKMEWFIILLNKKHLKHKQFMSIKGGGAGEKTPYTNTELRIIGLIGLRCVEEISDESCDRTVLVSSFNFIFI